MPALLFVLAVEVLAIAIRNNTNIKLCIGNIESKISLLAYDSTLMVNNMLSPRNALNILSFFYFASGLKINFGKKTEILQIGKITNSFLLYHKPFKLL